MNLRRSHIALLLLVLLSACTPKVPKEYIQPDDMEDILYDYFVSQGIAKQETGSTSDRLSDYKRELYFEAVLKKYDLTRAEFDSSLVYYYTRSDRFVKIWKNVQERLGEAAIEYGASAGEVQTFTASTLTGDTTNVWNGVISQVLVPYSPYNRLQFQIHAADTAYRKGDSFMLTWNSNFLYQSGSKDGVAYMAVRYKNDSIVSTVSHFSVDGYSQLRLEGCDEPMKEIKGFIYLGQGYEKTATMRMLIVSNIQLIRFHKKEQMEKAPEPQMSEADSLSQVPDSLRPRHHRLGERPNTIQPITR